MLDILLQDPNPAFRTWLASLENPTKTRQGFTIRTLPNDLLSDWIKLHGEHEPTTRSFILQHLKPHSALLDIGANIGFFSLLAPHMRQAQVVAFEPQRLICELLAQSVADNHFQNLIQVENLALFDTPSTMKMTSQPGNTGGRVLYPRKTPAPRSTWCLSWFWIPGLRNIPSHALFRFAKSILKAPNIMFFETCSSCWIVMVPLW